MPRLSDCLKQNYGLVAKSPEAKWINAQFKKYKSDGYSAKDAGVESVQDYVRKLEDDRKAVIVQLEQYVGEKPAPKPKSIAATAPKGDQTTTLRGRIQKMGGINPLNFKGEFKEASTGVKFLLKKSGEKIDLAEQRLKDEGWLRPDEELVMVLRDPANLRRGKVAGETGEKREDDKTEQEKRVEKEMAREVEAPPGDIQKDYVTMDADELPVGKKLTIVEGKSKDGWDVYQVLEKDEFGVTLKDGTTLTLRPGDSVEVRVADLEKAEPKGPTIVDNTPPTLEQTQAMGKMSEAEFKQAKKSPPVLELKGERQMPAAQAEMRTRGKKMGQDEQGGIEFGAPETEREKKIARFNEDIAHYKRAIVDQEKRTENAPFALRGVYQKEVEKWQEKIADLETKRDNLIAAGESIKLEGEKASPVEAQRAKEMMGKEDEPLSRYDENSPVDSMGNKRFWAKTRKELEQDLKDAVKSARGKRADINKQKATKDYAPWRIRSQSTTAKQDIESTRQYYQGLLDVHKERVAEAIEEGRPVPDEVLKDYPDLRRKPDEPSFAMGRPGTKTSAPRVLTRESAQHFADGFAREWENAPRVEAVQSQPQLPQEVLAFLKKKGAERDLVRGVFFKDKIYVVADNFTDHKDLMRTIVHESFGHYGIRRMLNAMGVWAPTMEMVYKSKLTDIQQIAKEYNYNLANERDRRFAVEEYLSREAELNPTSTTVERVVAAIRRGLRRLGLDLQMSDAEIRQLLINARQYVQTGRPANPIKLFGEAAFDKTSDAFKKWFGDSKVVDTNGEPLVVYHGTRADFDAFDLTEDGAFFTGSPAIGSNYATMGGNPGAKVLPIYLKIERPLVVSVSEWLNGKEDDGGDIGDLMSSPRYDGVKITGDKRHKDKLWRADVWVVTNSETQIKSAIGNRGTFDPNNSNIMFDKRTPAEAEQGRTASDAFDRSHEMREVKDGITTITRPNDPKQEAALSRKARGVLMQARQELDEVFGKGYVDRDMKMLQRVLETPYGLSKKFLSMAKAMKIEIMADETRKSMLYHYYKDFGLDQMQDYFTQNPADLTTFTDLMWKYEGKRFSESDVPTDAITWPKNTDEVPVINQSHYDEVKSYLMGQGYSDVLADHYVNLRKALDSVLVELDAKLRTGNLDPELITEFRSQIGQVHNYFPHRRKGDSQISIRDTEAVGTDNELVYRGHYFWKEDNLYRKMGRSNARQRAQDWLAGAISKGDLKGPIERYQIMRPDKVTQLPDEVFWHVPIEGMQQIAEVAGRSLERSRVATEADRLLKNGEVKTYAEGLEKARKVLTKDMEVALSQAIADTFKQRGFARHAIGRKGIPGFEKGDIFGVLQDYLSGFAGFTTKIERARLHNAVLREVDAKRNPEEYKYVSNYVRDMLANSDKHDRLVDGIRGLFFVKYLGWVVKSGLVNLTQNVVMAEPRLGMETKHPWKYLLKSMADVRGALTTMEGLKGKEVQYTNLSDNEREMIHSLWEKGLTIDVFFTELRGKVPGNSMAGRAWKKFVEHGGIFMRVAERYNRVSTALAAYRVGVEEQGLSHKAAIELAKQVVYDSHFIYGKHNLPMWARGGVLQKYIRSGYAFRGFSHNYLNLIHNWMTHQGSRGKLAVFRSFRNLSIVGGLGAMPFFDVLGKAVMMAFGEDDKEAMTAVRESLPEEWMRNTATYGLPGLAGVDLQGSLALDFPKSWAEILGVPYAAYKDTLNMVDSWTSGQKMRAVAESPITPIMVRNAMRGIELYTLGQFTRSGRPLNSPDQTGPRKIDEYDLVAKAAFGFQPTAISSGYAESQAIDQAIQYVKTHQSKIADRYVNAMNRQDADGMQEAINELIQWNDKRVAEGKPQLAITGDMFKASIRARMMQPIQKIPKNLRAEAMGGSKTWQ